MEAKEPAPGRLPRYRGVFWKYFGSFAPPGAIRKIKKKGTPLKRGAIPIINKKAHTSHTHPATARQQQVLITSS